MAFDFFLGYIRNVRKAYTFIDLFAGCGGLSEGFYQEGFKPLLHLEIDPVACKTLKTRMKYYGYSQETTDRVVLCEDITKDDIIETTDDRVRLFQQWEERKIQTPWMMILAIIYLRII